MQSKITADPPKRPVEALRQYRTLSIGRKIETFVFCRLMAAESAKSYRLPTYRGLRSATLIGCLYPNITIAPVGFLLEATGKVRMRRLDFRTPKHISRHQGKYIIKT